VPNGTPTASVLSLDTMAPVKHVRKGELGALAIAVPVLLLAFASGWARRVPVTFEFDWTPPVSNAGNLILYVATNAANGDNSERCDHIYAAKYTVTAPGTQSLPHAVSAGSWVSILGTNLAGKTRPWAIADFMGSALPTQLDGVGVKINGHTAYVAYIRPSQINVQAPARSALGPVAVEVNNNDANAAASGAQLQAASPAFFLWNGKYAVATRLDFSLVGPSGLFAVQSPSNVLLSVKR